MQSKATTVREYLASLPEDRRAALEAVRKVILANLDSDLEEGMSYGMIGYYVPHRVYPSGYHCDPKMPLPYAGLASQKNHMSLYMMGLYFGCEPGRPLTPLATWFQDAWKKTGKKLDMGKACIRFKKVEDLPLDVIGESIRRLPAAKYVEVYTGILASMGKGPKDAGKASKSPATSSKAKAKPAAAKPKASASGGPRRASSAPAKRAASAAKRPSGAARRTR